VNSSMQAEGSIGDEAIDPRALNERIAAIFWAAIILSGASAAYAISCARDLVYDGALYFLGWAAGGHLRLFIPVRESVQALQQCFEIAGERAGINNLPVLARLFSLGVSGWPVLLTVLCWFVLPRDRKAWIIGPLFNLVAVIPATSFFGIGEAIIASCLLWLLFLIFMFRMREAWGMIAAILLTVACGFTHEAAFVFLAGLSLLALARMPQRKGWQRAALLGVGLFSAAESLHLFLWVVYPRDSFERTNFLVSLFGGFLGTLDAPNLPALASLAAMTAIASMACYGNRAHLPRWPIVRVAAVLFLTILALFVHCEAVIAPSRYFEARGLPIVFTTVAALGLFLLERRGVEPARFFSLEICTLAAMLVLTQTTFQIVMTGRWQTFTSELRSVLSRQSGVISFTESSRMLNPGGQRFRRELLKSWSIEPLSIVLAPGGHVRAMLAPAADARWVPYRLDDPGTLPHVPELDWTGFSAHPMR
jgi:hypothetical protein